jgi:hypothetical protein
MIVALLQRYRCGQTNRQTAALSSSGPLRSRSQRGLCLRCKATGVDRQTDRQTGMQTNGRTSCGGGRSWEAPPGVNGGGGLSPTAV